MNPTKVTIPNRDDILGSVLLALATRCAGQQIAGGMTKDYLKEKGFFVLKFINTSQLERFKLYVEKYILSELREGLLIEPGSS